MAKESAFGLGPKVYWRRYRDSGVRLADWNAGLPAARRWTLRGAYIVEPESNGRVLFYIDAVGRMVLLHGFIKKTRATPSAELELARKNKGKHQRGMK
jgi:Gp49-like protein DUF891